MEQLIFFAVIIVLSIIESVARSRKQRKGGPLPEIPTDWEKEQAEQRRPRRTTQKLPRPMEVPSYDEDASFDARASSERERSFDEAATSEEERRKRSASSESMIPADIWEEIAGLAREAKVEVPKPKPRPEQRPMPRPGPTPQRPQRKSQGEPRRGATVAKQPPAPRPAASTPIRTATAQPTLEGTAAHAVHLSHAGYGTDPSQRVVSAQDGLDPLARAPNADAAAVRQQLRRRGAHALRQALILHEVLGPPAAGRPDRFD
jgi:hypothetical protein